MINFFKGLKEIHIAVLVILLICFIYLLPSFCGKVDTPTDIRNIRMYPWRYHSLDQKIKNLTLWEWKLPAEKTLTDPETKNAVFDLKVLPAKFTSIVLNTDWSAISKTNKVKLKEGNYFLSFDFKTVSNSNVAFDLGILLLNKATNQTYAPGVALSPLTKSHNGEARWYRAFYPLNNFLSKLDSLDEIENYAVQIAIKNKDTVVPSEVYIKEVKFGCEDFSKVKKVHNHYNNDLIQMFTPLREFFSKSIKKGNLPFWNHNILTGVEFLAEPQVGFFHPLYLLIYFIFDHFTAHHVLTFICFFLCGIGAYFLCRLWGLGFFASLFTSVVYMFNPFNVTWFSYEHMLMNSAVLPFLLLSFEKTINSKKLINKYLLLSSLLLGLIFLSGHLQYIYYTVIFFALYSIFRIITSKRPNALLSLVFIFIVGGMIGGIVLLPFFELFHESHRTANPTDLIKATSLPLKAFLGLFYPYYMGIPEWPLSGLANQSTEYISYRSAFARNYVYFGFLPFLFSLIALKNIKNKFVVFLFSLIIFSLLICTGSPLFYLLRSFLPGFKEMQHYRFLQIYSYCVPFLAGFGLQVVSDFIKSKLKNIVFVIIMIVTVIDLMYFSSYFVTWSDRKEYKSIPKHGVINYLLDKKKHGEQFRVLPFVSYKVEGASVKPDIAEPNTLLPFGLEDVSGYSSFIPKNIYYSFVYVQTMDASRLYSGKIFDLFSNINTPYPISNFHSKILDLLNVKYFIVPNFLTIDSPKVKKIFVSDSTIYENKNCLPRAFLVQNYKVIKNPEDIIVKLDSQDFDPRKEVILMEEPDINVGTLHATSLLRNGIHNDIDIKYHPNKITLKAKIIEPCFLILGNNLNNNWRVKINGKEGKHYQANLLQRAVWLSKIGENKIEFYYYPRTFMKGGLMSGFAILILFVLWAYLQIRR